VPVQVINNPGDLSTAASTTVDPNPVIAELKPIGPPPKPVRAKPKKPKAGLGLPPPVRPSPTRRPADALILCACADCGVRCNLPTLYARGRRG